MVPNPSTSLTEHDCTSLITALQVDLIWLWDNRFKTALAHIPVIETDIIKETLNRHLSTVWDSDTVSRAPENVQPVLIRLGGIMSSQLLYTAELPQGNLLFCAWWPWGNGQTISIRIGTDQGDSALLELLVPPYAR